MLHYCNQSFYTYNNRKSLMNDRLDAQNQYRGPHVHLYPNEISENIISRT